MRTLAYGLLITPLLLIGCSDNEVGDVSLGLFTTKDIKIETFTDPVVTGITCHISHVKGDLDLSDPSDMGISCQQTGPVTLDMINNINRSKSGEVVFKTSKSILWKHLKIRRIWDEKNKILIYLSYSTKETAGSAKHSMTTVTLWGTPVWDQLNQLDIPQ